MKTTFALLIAAIIGLAFIPYEKESLAIGAKAPNAKVEMKDVSGQSLSLKDIASDNGLLVIFSCNTCPFVIGRKSKDVEGWEGRYNEVYGWADKNKVGMVLVNSNAAKRDNGDAFDDMVTHHKEMKFKSHYVLDKNAELADAFGAKTTPHVFLFDKELRLVYKGAIDDNHASAKEVKEHYLKDAIEAMVAGKPITTNETKAIGCSIKRTERN